MTYTADRIVISAESIAKMVHRGYQRKGSGEPYFNHVYRVGIAAQQMESNVLAGKYLRTIGDLHDICEGGEGSDFRNDEAGLVRAVVGDSEEGREMRILMERDLRLLNRNYYSNYLDYILGMKNNLVRYVKLADLEDNLRDCPIGSRRDKYLMAQYILNT